MRTRAILGAAGARALVVAVAAVAACHGDIRFDDLMLCAKDADCLLSSLHCDSTLGTCVQCTADAQCTTPGLPICDTINGRCVECSTSGNCATGKVCHSARCVDPCGAGVTCPATAPMCDDGWCGQCDDGKGCATSTVGPYCAGKLCVACLNDANCGGGRPRCDPVAHACVVCTLNSDCPASTPLCDVGAGQCRAAP